MENNNPENGSLSIEAVRERTGIMEGSEEKLEDSPQPEPKVETPPEGKPEEGKPEEKVKAKAEGEKVEEPKPEPSPKNETRQVRAIFSQLKDLRTSLEAVAKRLDATPAEKKEVVAGIDEAVKAVAEKRDLDPEGLAEILSLAENRLMKNLEEKGLLKKDLPPELQEKLKILDEVEKVQKAEAERLHDEAEWNNFVPSLQKQYPNAPANLIAEAKKKMDELGHTKEFHDKELDYVLWKNKSVFDTILKVAKGTKAGESANKNIAEEEIDGEKPIDLDPENMTPEKAAAYQKRLLAMREKDGDGIISIG